MKNINNTKKASTYSIEVNKLATSLTLWRTVAIFALLLALISLAGMLYFAQRLPERAYVVEVDTSTGIATYKQDGITLLEDYTPSETSTLAALSSFIKYFREVTRDSTVQQEYINRVYSMITGQAVSFVENYYKENPPIIRLQSENVKITVYNAHRVATSSNESYQFLFNEKVFSNEDGSLIAENNYSMSLHVVFYQPRTERDRETNPLGIWIKDISISRIKGGQII